MDAATRERFEQLERVNQRNKEDIAALQVRVSYLEAQDALRLRMLYREAVIYGDTRTEAQRIRTSHGLPLYKHGTPAPQAESYGGTDDDG